MNHRYVQSYGYPVPTPYIQELAEQGVVFQQAYCAAPVSSQGSSLTAMACLVLLTGDFLSTIIIITLSTRFPKLGITLLLPPPGVELNLCGKEFPGFYPSSLLLYT